MSVVDFVDRYSSTLTASYTAGGTSLLIASATFLPSGTCNFYMIVRAEGSNTEEVFKVTNITGLTLTVVGAQANTLASNHNSGAVIIGSIWTAAAFQTLINAADNETPTGSINDSNTAYTLAHAPSPTGSLRLYKNGILQLQGTDYTLSSVTATFTTAPSTGDTLVAFYRY